LLKTGEWEIAYDYLYSDKSIHKLLGRASEHAMADAVLERMNIKYPIEK
jgi:hypothetical protein